MQFDSQLSRMSCHALSTGLSSRHIGGSDIRVMLGMHDNFGRSVPSGLIEQDGGMRARRYLKGDFLEMHAHCLAVAPRGMTMPVALP